MTYLSEDIPGYESGEFDAVNKSTFEVTFPDGAITSGRNKYYVGATNYYDDPNDDPYDASDIAKKTLSTAIGELPYFGWLWSGGTAAVNMYNNWADANEENESISRKWTWAEENGYRSQADYYVRFDAELDPNEEISFIVSDEGKAVRADKVSVIDLSNTYCYSITGPDHPDSTNRLGSLSSSNISSVPAKKVKNNPHQYGLTPPDVGHLDDDDTIRFATSGYSIGQGSMD
jgi:hypothetical protein